MSISMSRRTLAVLGLASSLPKAVSAQAAWPDRQVRFIVPFGAGSAVDTLSRLVANGFAAQANGQELTLAERGIKPPITLSHEIVGEVVSAGPQAGAVAAGRVALVHPWIGCGECAACKRGEENICIKPQSLGVVRPGGFAEYVIVPHPRYLVDIEG
ncbi:MAG: alcohol dehydrogenase catalytic domain-containing protein, partial [Alphaproteobacteria bacterium]